MIKPNVISHRGANIYAPQNTMPAFRKANEFAIDGYETDVHVTKDGKLVLCHNYTIDQTSNGKGKISELTLDELLEFDFGAYYSMKFRGTKIPTLDEFLEYVANETSISVLNIELKSPGTTETNMVSDTISFVKEHGLFDKLLISSFDPALLVQAKSIDKNCKTGFLYSPDKKWTYKNRMMSDPTGFAKEIKADALHPFSWYVSKKYVKKAHDNGILVNAWTVDSPKEICKMIDCGVDGIITNQPDVCLGIIDAKF